MSATDYSRSDGGPADLEVFGRMATLGMWRAGSSCVDLEDQFAARRMAEGQREYLQGVIEFFQARTARR